MQLEDWMLEEEWFCDSEKNRSFTSGEIEVTKGGSPDFCGFWWRSPA
jgi:hypothetical protein